MRTLHLYIYVLALLAVSCMPKIEDDPGIDKLLVTNHSVDKISSSDTDIIIQGTAPKDVTKIYISVDGEEYSEVKNASLARTLGVPTLTFANGSFTIRYPVPNPNVARTIVFKIRGGNSEGRQGQVEEYAINYNKPPSAAPGFAIVSAGGLIPMGSEFVLNSVGQSVSPYRSPASADGVNVGGTTVKFRYGLIGVLLE